MLFFSIVQDFILLLAWGFLNKWVTYAMVRFINPQNFSPFDARIYDFAQKGFALLTLLIVLSILIRDVVDVYFQTVLAIKKSSKDAQI